MELEERPLRLSMAEQNPPAGGSPSTVQSQEEEIASKSSDAETEQSITSEPSEAMVEQALKQVLSAACAPFFGVRRLGSSLGRGCPPSWHGRLCSSLLVSSRLHGRGPQLVST